MVSSGKPFFGSYLVRDGDKAVGCAVKSSVTNGVRSGKLLGFDISPDVTKYRRIVVLSGDPNLDGMLIPDTSILVKISDFFAGKFSGFEIGRESKLYDKYTLIRDGVRVKVSETERIRYERVPRSNLDLESLKSYVGGESWQPTKRRNKNENDKVDKNSEGKRETGSESKKEVKVKKTVSQVNVEGKHKRTVVSSVDSISQDASTDVDVERRDASGSLIYSEVHGDLFEVETGLILNCISADAHMGAGIAKRFAEEFPDDKILLLHTI